MFYCTFSLSLQQTLNSNYLMSLNEQYFGIMIAMGLAFLFSLVIFFKIQRKWLGCILQFFSFIGFSLILIFIFALFGIVREISNEADAMVGVRYVDETRDCRYETTWWIKSDNTYHSIFDKGSNDHKVEPCGNDHYSDKGTFIRIDSINAIQTDYNPPFIIYFDLDNQKVTPVWGEDTLEVVEAKWEIIKEYFKQP